jgi:hypothetical protein
MSLNCFALDALGGKLMFGAQVFSFSNFVLFVTSLISIRQFFWPGDEIRISFHVLNMVFILLFYGIGIPFLVANRQYYEGYADLTPLGVISEFFLSIDISSFEQWIIVPTFFINILYIRKYYKTYFESGITEPDYPVNTQRDVVATNVETKEGLEQE